MLITNDVALITFVPFAGAVLGMAGLTDRIVPVVVFQTVAANLGSMATPVGNPQNLYLYSHYGVPLGEFFGAVLPFAGLSLVLLTGALLMRRSAPLLHRRTAPACPGTAAVLSGTVPAQPCGSRQADSGAAAGAHGDGSYSAH